uniref:Uncharacterized protein n=1 Tax=Anguilla anguilla TaxID=7936 RepID=A0A0E9UHE2_ANGAN
MICDISLVQGLLRLTLTTKEQTTVATGILFQNIALNVLLLRVHYFMQNSERVVG